jgi:hypothetical protein
MSHPPPPEGESPEPGRDPGGPGVPGGARPPYGPGQQPPYAYDPQRQPYGYDPGQPGGTAWQYPHGQPGAAQPEHPGAVPSLILGVVALGGGLTCVLAPLTVLGPWAWVKGRRTVNEIDASGGRYGGRGLAQAGYVCGVLGTVLLGVFVLLAIAVVVLGVAFVPGDS